MTKPDETRAMDRLRAKASGMARSELIQRHKAEYDQLYVFYCGHLGVEVDGRRSSRPVAPPFVGGDGDTP